MTVDYIIVGQGLAGTVLAHTFIKEEKKILIVDEPNISSCSRVSAGNYNPVVFRRLVKSWKADDIIPFADGFYSEAQSFLKTDFFWKKEIVHIFSEEHEKKLWEKKTGEEAGKYFSNGITNDFHTDVINNPIGCGVVEGAGNLYVEKFVEEFRKYFLNKKLLLQETFDFNALKFNKAHAGNDTVHYKNIFAQKIIFCEGWKAMGNPLFSYLPFKPAKGEALILSIKNFPHTDKIIHKGISLFYIGDDLFFCGSTYEWKELNDFSTEKGKAEIIEKLKKLIKIPFEVVDQKAGVRPSITDRKPIIGLHPENKCTGIFNGLGTKGVMLAPYFAKEFFNFLENGIPLEEEVDVSRFS